ncbi:nitrogen regulation protein NR(I) [Aquisalimonas sp. APHAB1-3]|uniref:nitrogen regulation protein NR(I) n=1 Tax=Aquisalimonas sp. APHAB1-3 TaxID=3402080 RepID=UPI003AAD447F
MTTKDDVWLVDDDRSIRWVLDKALRQAGLQARSFETGDAALGALAEQRPGVLVTDIRMPGIDGLALLERVQQRWPDLPVIVITAHSDLDAAVSAYKGGAFEYLPKPFDVDEAVDLVRKALQSAHETAAGGLHAGEENPEIIGEAPAMQEVFRAIGRLSSSNITVLINGESGTGKELVAQALHRHSPRRDRPFVALNMAAIPRDLMESELFGHEKGAFTGAQQTRQGRFEQADGGTLFLDEIGDMPAELQTRLLRVLADGEFYRVGGHTPRTVDVRIIAATHQDLESRVAEGTFREDLFHRLNVIRIHLPALRERREDIPKLARFFLQGAAEDLNVEAKQLRPEVERFLMGLTWAGNVRQLENTCRWLTVMANGKEIHMEDLPPELRQDKMVESSADDWEESLAVWAERALARGEEHILDHATPRFERIMIEVAIRATGGRRQEAARLLGWGRNTLTRKIKELDMGF